MGQILELTRGEILQMNRSVVDQGLKYCTEHGEFLPIEEFYETKKANLCRTHINKQTAAFRRERDSNWTPEQYRAAFKAQNGICAIKACDRKLEGRYAADHCHKTGKRRALLCMRCNTVLGRIEDNLDLLQSMIDYLESHKEGTS